MPLVTCPLAPEGAMVDVRIGWSAGQIRTLRAAHWPIPQAVDLRAIIDTGADVSALDRSVVQSLQLPVGGIIPANVPGGSGLIFTSEHEAGLTNLAPQGSGQADLIVSDLLVLELDLASLGYQALIGRDILARCRFLYDGPHRQFTLEY